MLALDMVDVVEADLEVLDLEVLDLEVVHPSKGWNLGHHLEVIDLHHHPAGLGIALTPADYSKTDQIVSLLQQHPTASLEVLDLGHRIHHPWADLFH
jgi:hypothetical protein